MATRYKAVSLLLFVAGLTLVLAGEKELASLPMAAAILLAGASLVYDPELS
jgi:hypothetical protein